MQEQLVQERSARMLGSAYLIGPDMFKKRVPRTWNPDELNNGHLLIWGGSGSGKTLILKDIVAYLRDRNKHIHVLDLHGDVEVEGGNEMEFGTWDSQYGINPFEFLREYNAGPEQQANVIVEMFRKTYMRNMGPLQEAVLRKLIMDTYELKGIKPRDMQTWGPEDNSKLPVMEDMLALIQHILSQDDKAAEKKEEAMPTEAPRSREATIGEALLKLGGKLGKLSRDLRELLISLEEVQEKTATDEEINRLLQMLFIATTTNNFITPVGFLQIFCQ